MRHKNIMLKQMADSIGDTVPLHIWYVPDIPTIKNNLTPLGSNETFLPTYSQLHMPVLLQVKPDKKGPQKEILYGNYSNDECKLSLL